MARNICTVDGCAALVRGRGLCSVHYFRSRRHGSITATRGPESDWRPRFWSKVDTSGDCWLWTGRVQSEGYGVLTFQSSQRRLAHRLSWEMANGPIPDGLYVCHSCDTTRCVRPTHLFVGTHLENMADMRSKGRQSNQYKKAALEATT